MVVDEVSTSPDRKKLIEEFKQAGFRKLEEYLGGNTVEVYRSSKIMKHTRKALLKESYAIVFQKPSG